MKSTTPLKAIRAMCIYCTIGEFKAIRECPEVECPIYPYRLGKGRPSVKIIRKFCLRICWGGSHKQVAQCNGDGGRCPLWPYRMGRNPKLVGRGGGFSRRFNGKKVA